MRRLAFAFRAAAFIVAASIMCGGAASARTAHDFEFTSINGGALPLDAYAGNPILVVNTASFCGFTYQYDGLQALWSAYRDRGFVLIGAPSQDFDQEYGDESQVKAFCEVNFSIDFPMTKIVSVRGRAAHPFFEWAAREAGAPRWNFNKYLIDAEGQIVKRYGSRTRPEEIAADIEALLLR